MVKVFGLLIGAFVALSFALSSIPDVETAHDAAALAGPVVQTASAVSDALDPDVIELFGAVEASASIDTVTVDGTAIPWFATVGTSIGWEVATSTGDLTVGINAASESSDIAVTYTYIRGGVLRTIEGFWWAVPAAFLIFLVMAGWTAVKRRSSRR